MPLYKRIKEGKRAKMSTGVKREYAPNEEVPNSTPVKTARLTTEPAPTSGKNETSLSTSKRLMGEWKAAQRRQDGQLNDADPESHLSFGFVEEDDCTMWYCRKYYVEIAEATAEYRSIRGGLIKKDLDYVEWRMRFSPQYPFLPPRVWLHYPHLGSTNVWANGGICAQVISEHTGGGWSPAMNVNTLMISITNTTEGYKGVHVKQGKYKPHTEEGAMSDFTRIEAAHSGGWGETKTNK